MQRERQAVPAEGAAIRAYFESRPGVYQRESLCLHIQDIDHIQYSLQAIQITDYS